MVLKFVFCVIIGLIDCYFLKRLMQKTYLFSLQIGMPQANAQNFIGYTDTELFLTIGKPDIYQLKSLGKSATVFIRVTNNYRNWLPTYLIISAIDIRLTYIRRLYIYHITNSREEYCIPVYPTDFRCICMRPSYLHRK
jgi:hypothetical protein